MLIVDVAQVILNNVFLYFLGLIGWWLGKIIHLPAPFVLGSVFLIGGLRIIGVDLPDVHVGVIIAVQISLGVMVGAQFDRESFSALRLYIKPAFLVAVWAVSVTFLFGFIISVITPLDTITAVLGSSIGGLAEMTVLAYDTGADSVTVVLFHLVRVLATMFLIPFLVQTVIKPAALTDGEVQCDHARNDIKDNTETESEKAPEQRKVIGQSVGRGAVFKEKKMKLSISHLVVTLALAGGFGGLLMYLGVPAGGLVGSLLFVMVASYYELPIQVPPSRTLDYFLVGIGLMVSSEIEPETIRLIFTAEIGLALVLSLVLTFSSALLMTHIVYKITGWDYLECFLACAPAGFTVMIAYAIAEGYDPIPVSLLQLSRLVTLKLAIPFIFMIFYY